MNKNGLRVLSLCDGMSCGHIALDRAGIPVACYYAAEIKKIGIKVTMDNYPDTVQIGDVNKISYKDGVLHTENGDFEQEFDLVMFGSPCQTFSITQAKERRVGFENKEKSGLFWECKRILDEVNPRWFLMENVASMKNEWSDIITNAMGVKPIRINSKLVSAQLRDRLYWTNIQGVTQPEDRGILLKDILESGYTDREKSKAIITCESRAGRIESAVKHYKEKHFNRMVVFENALLTDESARHLTQTELERLQTVPVGYTRCLTRNQAANVLGDGWTVDVIAHILRGIKDE